MAIIANIRAINFQLDNNNNFSVYSTAQLLFIANRDYLVFSRQSQLFLCSHRILAIVRQRCYVFLG